MITKPPKGRLFSWPNAEQQTDWAGYAVRKT